MIRLNRKQMTAINRQPGQVHRQHGFTLAEMVVVIIIVGIIFAVGAMLVGRSFENYSISRDATDIEGQARVALERISRELREVRGKSNSTDLDIGTVGEVTFSDATTGTLIRFYRDGTTNRLMRQENLSPPQPLADSITAMSISYFDKNAVSTGVLAEVYYIKAEITVSKGSLNDSFSTTVKVRNFE